MIVPIYNVEQYLKECLDSIVNQSYRNLEIVCVNDGSPDESEKIINDFASKDHRIKVVNQKNTGLNMARAAGFRKSTGDYITFVDGDDVIHEQAIDVALKNIVETSSDIAIFGYRDFMKTPTEIDAEVTLRNKILTTKESIFRYLLVNHIPQFNIHNSLNLTVWGKLYRREIVSGIDWKKTNYRQHEDLLWTPYAFSGIRRSICLNTSTLYFYRRDPDRPNVLSKAIAGNTLNGKPVGYMELAHNFSTLIEGILRANHLMDTLKREFECAAYDMYRLHVGDLVRENMVESENNTQFIPEYYQYSELHIKTQADTLADQDRRIKSEGLRIGELESQLQDINNKLKPEHASVKQLVSLLLRTTRYRARRYYKRIFEQ